VIIHFHWFKGMLLHLTHKLSSRSPSSEHVNLGMSHVMGVHLHASASGLAARMHSEPKAKCMSSLSLGISHSRSTEYQCTTPRVVTFQFSSESTKDCDDVSYITLRLPVIVTRSEKIQAVLEYVLQDKNYYYYYYNRFTALFPGPCTRVSWCQKRTAGLYGAREDQQRQTYRPSG